MTPTQAKAFCIKAEETLSVHGLHIGLTGSQLYGRMNSRKETPDLDVVIYPHESFFPAGTDNDRSRRTTLELIGVQNSHRAINEEEASEYARTIYTGTLADGTKIDAFFLK